MKTIENIKIDKTYYQNTTDENGNAVKIEKKHNVKRDPVLVTQGVRFGYYLIDVVFIYITAFVLGIVFALFGLENILDDDISSRIFGMLLIVAYYFILEASIGTSIGKLICGYTVINQYAEKPSISAILGRSFSRIVPFEAFSCFAERGWHDKWSNTYVVKNSEKEKLRRLLGNLSERHDILD